MARGFAYLMSNDLDSLTDQGIFSDTSTTIQVALKKAYNSNNHKTGLARTAFEQALEQLVN
jgi:glutamate dehydrogenase (NAD(P)+)